MRGRAISYSAAERAFVEANCRLRVDELHAAFVAAFARTDVSAANLNALRKREGWRTGRDGRFSNGNEPWSKGRTGVAPEAFRRHQFRKGGLPHNTKYLGHERVSKDGYVEISVDEPNPHTGFERRYVLKHVWLWEQANGKLPAGMCLKCLDGDRANADPANWKAIPRAMLPRLGGRYGRNYDAAAPELKPAIMAVATLEHVVRVRTRGERPARPTGRRAGVRTGGGA